MSHSPGDQSSTVSPSSQIRRQWPVRAMLSMVPKTSVCSSSSRRVSCNTSSVRQCGAQLFSLRKHPAPSPGHCRSPWNARGSSRPAPSVPGRARHGDTPAVRPCAPLQSCSSTWVSASKEHLGCRHPGVRTDRNPCRRRAAHWRKTTATPCPADETQQSHRNRIQHGLKAGLYRQHGCGVCGQDGLL